MSNGTASSGQLFEFASIIVKHVPTALADMDAATLQGWIDDRSGAVAKALRHTFDPPAGNKIAKLVVGNRLPGGIYPVTVDYGQSLQAMIAAGHYDWWDKDILRAGFTVEGTGQVEVELGLYHANRFISSGGLISEIGPKDLRPANHAECLAFGAKYPDIQRQFPIIALGSVGQLLGHRRVVDLHRLGAERRLDLRWDDGGVWGDDCRFLVARKPKA